MQIVNGEYNEDCTNLSMIVSHNKGKQTVKFKVVFNFQTEHVERISVYRAPRYFDLQAAVKNIIEKYDFRADEQTQFASHTEQTAVLAEKLQLYYYFCSRSCACA